MVSLLADLDRLELSGTGFGDEIVGLAFLGPSDTGAFDYAGKGLRIEVEDDRLVGFVVALRAEAYLGPSAVSSGRAFAGRIRMDGRDLQPDELRTEQQFEAAWGEPYWRDEDSDERLLFFEFPGGELQVELTLEGVPQVIVATPQPLMADPEQRARYGVTQPWPPSRTGG